MRLERTGFGVSVIEPRLAGHRAGVYRKGRLMIRYGWMGYRGLFIGDRADPADRLRVLLYRAHLVVSWLPENRPIAIRMEFVDGTE